MAGTGPAMTKQTSYAWPYQENLERPGSDRARPRMDARALRPHRRNRHGIGARLQRPGLPTDRNPCGVLDGGGTASFQDLQAARSGDRGRPAAGLYEKRTGRA